MTSAIEEKVNMKSEKPKPEAFYGAADPQRMAVRFLKVRGRDADSHWALRFWRDEFWRCHEGRYQRISRAELQAKVSEFINEEFQRTKPTNNKGQIFQVTSSLVNNVMLALQGKVLVDSHLEQPIWLGNGHQGPYFVFGNGMVNGDDVTRGNQARLERHCAQWFTQTTFPYNFDPAATCPRWLAFLDDVLEGDEERIHLLQQWFGYCLTNDTSQQRFVVAVGEGQNGKSVMLDVLTAMLGPENVSHVRVELFAQRFQLTMTLGKLANVSYDTGKIDESAEATIKEFTGGDRMYFDRKGVPGIFAYPTARLIMATNQEPRFADRSKGIWRRMIVIPFRVSVERDRQDPRLAEKLKAELPGIFNWAIEGLRDLNRVGQFITPAVCQEAWEEFRRDSNPAREFLNDSCSAADLNALVPCNDLYNDYCAWCGSQQLKALDATSFGKELKKVFPLSERHREGGGQRRYCYRGIRRVAAVELMALPVEA